MESLRQTLDERGRHEISVPQVTAEVEHLSPAKNLAAFFLCDVNIRHDLIKMRFRNKSADICLLIQRITDFELFYSTQKAGAEFLIDRLLNKYS